MSETNQLKLFISYCHKDEDRIDEFRKHTAPLKNNGLISEWYDRKIIAGQNFGKNIRNSLEDADIICLFISANFLSSTECLKEKNEAIKLKKKKGVSVIPVILSDCGWLDDPDISPLLALPTDGNPIANFEDSDVAWTCVYKELKPLILKIISIRQLKISNEFTSFLQSTELLTKAHSQKEEVLLEHIFVYPELAKYDSLREYEKKESPEKVLDNFYDHARILIAGENQSGKTTLCKKLYLELRRKNFIPIYVSDKNNFLGKIENKILEAFDHQYDNETSLEEIGIDRVVPIIDDFHFAKNKEKIIQALTRYHYQIIIVDDIFSLNFRDEKLTRSFKHFKIEEFSPSQRNALIKKWRQLADSNYRRLSNENSKYQGIDRTTELVDSALGKSIGSGIMPAYPFFILTVIGTYETFTKSLSEEITSQGHCYQALIYIYLIKQGVKNDDIDTYVNFLTELAFYLYEKKKYELTVNEFDVFMSFYKGKYNLPISEKTLRSNLQKTNIFSPDGFSNYSFSYSYLYFFFVAKYLAEHLDDNKEAIGYIINNLHKNDNAYIAIFISHHSKNIFLLKEIIRIASGLFEKYTPLGLTRDELRFFDEQANTIAQAVLPGTDNIPEREREQDLLAQDQIEELNENDELDNEEDDDDELIRELRRSIKTVEVMGTIIKNRAGSLERDKLEDVFEAGMNVHLRVLQSFIEFVKTEENQQDMVAFILSRLQLMEKNKGKALSDSKLEKLSKIIFWNMNFFTVFSVIDKIIHSLGSDKLIEIIETVCDRKHTPAAFLVKHGILMWYSKNLQIDDVTDRIKSDDFSKIAENILRHRIVDHYRIHSIGYRERQQIEHALNIPSKKLLAHRPR